MRTLIVVDKPKHWPINIPGVEVVSARSYLTDEALSDIRLARVFNLCRSYRYQTAGYYVSLLAEARGHRATPKMSTIQDMKSQAVVKIASDELDDLIQHSLAAIQSDKYTLSVYFGESLVKRHERLALKLFGAFHVPFMRAQFSRGKKWSLQSLQPMASSEIPEEHRAFVQQAAIEYFSRRRVRLHRRRPARYDIALLRNAVETTPPSDERAIRKFIKAAESRDADVEVIGREDYGRLAEFDALFIRETTSVNHHTFRFARRAEWEGLAVIDDPESILKCANKVFLAELLRKRGVPTPQTLIIHQDNVAQAPALLGFPLILKQPDSYFSLGVTKVESEQEYYYEAERLLDDSDMIIAQRFMPTEFDWRVGVLDRRPLFVCRYYMASGHWQIINKNVVGARREGDADCVPVGQAPPAVLRTALRAANLVGDGLYGVDLKQVGRRVYVIEVNDNPNIDAGYEDQAMGDALYLEIVDSIIRRIEVRRSRRP
ncbi:MAG: RimK family protein [Nitrospinae bacterium]|nr:RimK family protein [Nitrospinota bacterium]